MVTKMARKAGDLIIHPVRIRILSALHQETLTTAEIHARFPDVSLRTLYRHLEELVVGGALEVAETRRVRGAVEQRFRLARPPLLSAEDRQRAVPQDWQRFFTLITSLLNAEFATFVHTRHGSEGLSLTNAVRLSEVVATPEQIDTLVKDLTTRADQVVGETTDSARVRYRIGLFVFPLEPSLPEER